MSPTSYRAAPPRGDLRTVPWPGRSVNPPYRPGRAEGLPPRIGRPLPRRHAKAHAVGQPHLALGDAEGDPPRPEGFDDGLVQLALGTGVVGHAHPRAGERPDARLVDLV